MSELGGGGSLYSHVQFEHEHVRESLYRWGYSLIHGGLYIVGRGPGPCTQEVGKVVAGDETLYKVALVGR